MKNSALHVLNKTRDEFDAENRVLPSNVLALCTDTSQFKVGDGVTRWRDLALFTPDSEGPGVPANMDDARPYAGPLHFEALSSTQYEPEFDSFYGDSGQKVPSANEMIVAPAWFAFGNGVTPLGQLPRFVPADTALGATPSLPKSVSGRVHLTSGTDAQLAEEDRVFGLGHMVVANGEAVEIGNGALRYSQLALYRKDEPVPEDD